MTATATPDGLYPLTRFNLQTDRDTTPADGNADIINNADLQGFYEPGMFERTGSYFRFTVDSDGATTPGSPYPRVELRDETEYDQDTTTEYRVDAQVIALPDGEDTIIMQILDNDNGTHSAAVKVEVKGRAALATNAWLRFKYDPTFGGAETAFNLSESIVVDGSGGFVVPPIRVRRGNDFLEVYFGANVDGATPDWSAGDNAPIGGAPTPAFSRTPSANFTYYWKSGNYLQNNQTSPAIQCIVDQISGTWASPAIVSGAWTFVPPPGWIEDLTVTPYIVQRSVDQAFPETVYLGATVTGPVSNTPDATTGFIDSLHDYDYMWDGFHSTTVQQVDFTHNTRIWRENDRHAGGHQNSRFQFAPKAAFTYNSDGSVTVRCYVFHMATQRWGRGDITFTVLDQDATYPGTQTIYADPSGTYTDAPAGCVQTTESDVLTLCQTYLTTSNAVRFLYAAGQSFTWPSTDSLGAWYGLDHAGFVMTRRGTGANPTFTNNVGWRADERGASTLVKDLKFDQLDFQGTFNDLSTTPGTGGQIIGFLNVNSPRYTLINRCTGSGLGNIYSHTTDTQTAARYVAMIGCDFENFAFGTLSGRLDGCALVGNRLRSRIDSYNDSGGGGGWVHRLNAGLLVSHSNECFRRQGNSFGKLGGQWVTQPMLRINPERSQAVNGDEYYSMCDFFEGSWEAFQSKDSNGNPERPINCRIGMGTFIAGYQTDQVIVVGSGGTSIHDCLMIVPNAVTKLGNGFVNFVRCQATSLDATNQAAPIKVWNSMGVNFIEAAVNPFGNVAPAVMLNNASGFTTALAENNGREQPRMSPSQSDGPLLEATDYFGIEDTGYRGGVSGGDAGDLRATYVSTRTSGTGQPDNFDVFAPLTTSNLIQGATAGRISYHDWRGVERPQTRAAVGGKTDHDAGHFETSLTV